MATAPKVEPRLGRLDDRKFAHELAIRGITARQLAAKAGINEVVLARVRRAPHVRPATLLRLAIALSKIPVNPQLVKILPDPPGNGHAGIDVPMKAKTTSAPRAGRQGDQRASASRRR